MRIVGWILILLGIVMMVTGGFSFKTIEKVIDTKAIDISRTKQKTVTWPWFAGGVAMLAGTLVLLTSRKRS